MNTKQKYHHTTSATSTRDSLPIADNLSDTLNRNRQRHPDVLPFPVEVFPAKLQLLIRQASLSMHCPPEFVGLHMLSVLGVAIGTRRCVEVKPGWREYAVIWTAIVANPGSAKSPALDVAVAPLHEVQARFRREYEDALRQRQQSKREKKPGSRPVSAPPPQMRQIYSTDATVEALASVLHANPHGIGFPQDELIALVKRFNEYKRSGCGADRQIWQSNWSCTPWAVNRKNEPQFIDIARPFVAPMGCLAPDMLSTLNDERGREDGFVHRFLFGYPDELPLKWEEAGISLAAREKYQEVFDSLLKLPLSMSLTRTPSTTSVVRFTEYGNAAFGSWMEQHYEEINDPGFPVNLRGPWRKLESYFARLALILQLTRKVCGEADGQNVDEVSVRDSAKLIEYAKSHDQRVYSHLNADPQEMRILKAIAFIRKQRDRSATVRDFVTGKIAGCRTAGDVEALFWHMELENYGHVEQPESDHGGRPTIIFRLGESHR
jgi:uncharacterized protein DUF3987